jgi:long-chain fatty acid transport protein
MLSKPSRNQVFHLALALSLLTLLIPGVVTAGGLTMYEIGTPDMGYATAGYAARADDPGTLLTNPAGMTRLQGSQVLVGGHLLYGHAHFSPDGDTSPALGNDDGGNALGILPGLNAFATYKVNNDLALGFGIFSNFGLGLWYDSDWVGRYYAKQAILMGVSFMPAAAYRLTDKLSVGVGVNIMAGYLKNTVAINNADPAWSDGELHVRDTTVGFGANVGLLYELSKTTRFGVTYSSPVTLDFSDDPEFDNTAPGIDAIITNRGWRDKSLDLGITVPQAVMASFYHELNSQWALLGNFGWQDWSEFGKIDVSFNSTSLTKNLKYRDTWHGALGAQYRLSEPWLITGGVAYDSGMLDDSNRSPALPLNWAWRFALGAQYTWSKTVQIGLAYEYLYSGNPDISKSSGLPVVLGGRGDLSGSYPNMSIQFFSANVAWKF